MAEEILYIIEKRIKVYIDAQKISGTNYWTLPVRRKVFIDLMDDISLPQRIRTYINALKIDTESGPFYYLPIIRQVKISIAEESLQMYYGYGDGYGVDYGY